MGSRDGMLNHITLHHLQNFFHDHHDAGWLPDQGFFDQDELISFTQNLIKSCEKMFPSSSHQSVLTRHVSTNFSKYEDDDLLKPYRKCLSNTLLKTEFDATWIREYTKNTKYILFSEDLDLRAAIDKAKNDNVINFAEMLVVDRLASKKYETDSLTPVKTTNEQSDTDLLESF